MGHNIYLRRERERVSERDRETGWGGEEREVLEEL